MSNDNLPACPVCGEAPRYTLTFAGNHALRCDGPIPGDSPRHTIYVLHPQLDAARALWTKAVAQQPATAAPVTDADIDAAIRHRLMAGLDDVGVTMELRASIESFEAGYLGEMPWIGRMPAQGA